MTNTQAEGLKDLAFLSAIAKIVTLTDETADEIYDLLVPIEKQKFVERDKVREILREFERELSQLKNG